MTYNKYFAIPYAITAFVIGITLSSAYAVDTFTCNSPETACTITFANTILPPPPQEPTTGSCPDGQYLQGFNIDGSLKCAVLSSGSYPEWVDAFDTDGYNTIYLKPDSQYTYLSLGDPTPASEFVNDCNRFALAADCGIEVVAKEGTAAVYYFSRGEVPGKQLLYSILANTDGSITFTKQGDYDNTADRTDIQITRNGLIYSYDPIYIKDTAGTFCKLTASTSGAVTCQH